MADMELTAITNARRALYQARTIPEFKRIRDEGHSAIEHALRLRVGAVEAVNDAMEIVLRAERYMGEQLAAMEKIGNRPKKGSKVVPFWKQLIELEISKTSAKRYQAEAAVHEADFERWLTDTCSEGCRLTSDELIRMGRAAGQDKTLADLNEEQEARNVHEKTVAAHKALVRGLDTLGLYEPHAVPLHAIHKTLETNDPSKKGG